VRPRIRVAQVITAFNDDAPAQSAAVLAKYLDSTKFEVVAVSLRAQEGQASKTVLDMEAAGISHTSLGMHGFLDLTGVVRLVQFMRQHRPDIVHSHAFRADFWCGVAGRLTGVPLVVNTIRNHDSQVFRMERSFVVGKTAAGASRLATTLADTVVAVSAGVADYLITEQRVPSSKIHVIRNGFDFGQLTENRPSRSTLRAQFGWQRHDVVIGTLAVLKPRKGLAYLVQAARTVLEVYPHARFFIAGEGPDRSTLEAQIAHLGLREHVRLLGQRDDPLALLEAADIFVLPSLFEGLPRSLLEAMALAKPVVVTDIGGSREVVRHEETGLIVPPRNPGSLAQSLSRLVASPEERRAYGEAGRLAIDQKFSARRTALAHEAVYGTLEQRKKSSSEVRPSGRTKGT